MPGCVRWPAGRPGSPPCERRRLTSGPTGTTLRIRQQLPSGCCTSRCDVVQARPEDSRLVVEVDNGRGARWGGENGRPPRAWHPSCRDHGRRSRPVRRLLHGFAGNGSSSISARTRTSRQSSACRALVCGRPTSTPATVRSWSCSSTRRPRLSRPCPARTPSAAAMSRSA